MNPNESLTGGNNYKTGGKNFLNDFVDKHGKKKAIAFGVAIVAVIALIISLICFLTSDGGLLGSNENTYNVKTSSKVGTYASMENVLFSYTNDNNLQIITETSGNDGLRKYYVFKNSKEITTENYKDKEALAVFSVNYESYDVDAIIKKIAYTFKKDSKEGKELVEFLVKGFLPSMGTDESEQILKYLAVDYSKKAKIIININGKNSINLSIDDNAILNIK